MRFPFRLLWQNLAKHRVRTALTVGSLIVATFLICTLVTLVTTLNAGIKHARSERIITQSAVSLFVYLPDAYLPKIKTIPGVVEVCTWNWFGGIYQDPKNFFASFGVDHSTMFSMYPEIELVEGDKDAFESDRQACIIGVDLADKFDFAIGQTIPMQGTLFQRAGGEAWPIKVAGIYKSNTPNVDEQTMFFHYDYIRESLEQKAADGPPGVSVIVIKVAEGADPVQIMGAVDAMFASGPQRTLTTSESEFNAQFVSMMGNIPFFVGSIGTAVFLAILLAVINTMLMAAREQSRDVGILKALGFKARTVFALFCGQSIALTAIGGAIGVALAKAMETPISIFLAKMFPNYFVVDTTLMFGFGLAIVVGLAAGIAPAILLARTKVVDALRTEA